MKRRLKGKVKVLDEVENIHWHDGIVYRLQKVVHPGVEGTQHNEPSVEIRIAYWYPEKFGQFAPILPEGELAELIGKAIEKGILSEEFVRILRHYCES